MSLITSFTTFQIVKIDVNSFFHFTQEAVLEPSASSKMLLDCYWVDCEMILGNWKMFFLNSDQQ